MSTPSTRSHARSGTRSGLVAGCVLVAAAGDLLLLPLMSLRIASLTLLVLAAAGLYQTLPRLRRARDSGWIASLRRAPAAWAFAAFVAVLLGGACLAYLRSPDPAAAKTELTGLLTGVLLAAGTAAATGGSARGLHGMRLGWAVGLALALLTAAVELVTGLRVHADASLAWALDPTIVAGQFRNPNDLASVLAVLVSGTIAYRAGTRSRVLRAALAGLAALGVAAVSLTQSRGGLVAIVLVLTIHGTRALLDRRTSSRQSPHLSVLPAHGMPGASRGAGSPATARGTGSPAAARAGHWEARTRRTLTWSVAVTAAVAAMAAFTVPALVRVNPVATMITAAGRPGTARSDTLRLDLIRAGWRYFAESDRLGTGAGSFEHLLAADPNAGVSHIIWMHNSFMELLLQYGVIVGGTLLIVVLVIMAEMFTGVARSPRRQSRARPPRSPYVADAADVADAILHQRERRLVVAETLSALVAFGALGTLAYTALETHAWWMMLAQAVAGAWWLTAAPPFGPWTKPMASPARVPSTW